MSLSLDQVLRIAELARIELAPGEAGQTRDQLNGIFALIEEMQAVNTAGASAISAVANALGHRRFPFVFGGDGASFAVCGGRSVQETSRRSSSRAGRLSARSNFVIGTR